MLSWDGGEGVRESHGAQGVPTVLSLAGDQDGQYLCKQSMAFPFKGTEIK